MIFDNKPKVLLVHHGGHRGGYGVCWDLRAEDRGYLAGKDRVLADFGIMTAEQFRTVNPDAKILEWKGVAYQATVHFPDKESAIKEAERRGLEIITPQELSKEIRRIVTNEPS